MKTKEDNFDVLDTIILDKKEKKKVIKLIPKEIESRFKAHKMKRKE